MKTITVNKEIINALQSYENFSEGQTIKNEDGSEEWIHEECFLEVEDGKGFRFDATCKSEGCEDEGAWTYKFNSKKIEIGDVIEIN